MSLHKIPRFIRALILLMFLSAVIHVVVLVMYFVKTGDVSPFNFFSIVGAHLFFPILVSSHLATLVSFVVAASLYAIIFFFFTHENRRP